RERGLCLDYGQVVVDSSLKPVGGLLQGFSRQLDIAAGDVDEFGGGLQIEQAVAQLLVDLAREIVELRAELVELRDGHVVIAAKLRLLKDGHREASLCGKGAVIDEAGDAGDAVIALEGQAGEAL